MAEIDSLVSNFVDDWNAGRRPLIEDWLVRADAADRDELRRQLGAFLAVAPTPRYDRGTVDALLNSVIAESAAAAFETGQGAWPSLLPRLRTQAGLSMRELAERLLVIAGIDAGDVGKAESYLGEMENGALDATRVSGRVIDVLGRVLGIRAPDLLHVGLPAAAPAGGALFRQEDAARPGGVDLDLLADALGAPAVGPELDEVDVLFFGDR